MPISSIFKRIFEQTKPEKFSTNREISFLHHLLFSKRFCAPSSGKTKHFSSFLKIFLHSAETNNKIHHIKAKTMKIIFSRHNFFYEKCMPLIITMFQVAETLRPRVTSI
jgi:hypothetical protein